MSSIYSNSGATARRDQWYDVMYLNPVLYNVVYQVLRAFPAVQ